MADWYTTEAYAHPTPTMILWEYQALARACVAAARPGAHPLWTTLVTRHLARLQAWGCEVPPTAHA